MRDQPVDHQHLLRARRRSGRSSARKRSSTPHPAWPAAPQAMSASAFAQHHNGHAIRVWMTLELPRLLNAGPTTRREQPHQPLAGNSGPADADPSPLSMAVRLPSPSQGLQARSGESDRGDHLLVHPEATHNSKSEQQTSQTQHRQHHDERHQPSDHTGPSHRRQTWPASALIYFSVG